MTETRGGSTGDQRFEDARQLWAGRFQAVIATHSLADPGYPFASVLPYCLDRQGQALVLLSHLAQHTRNVETNPRCGLSVSQPSDGDIQQSLRLSCPAEAEPVDPGEHESFARWFSYYPASRPYLEQLNFRLYRLHPLRFHYNGGFATARWLGKDRVLRASTLGAQAEDLLLTALEDLPDRLARLGADPAHPPRLAGVDPWGLDLALGQRLLRLPLPGPLTTPESVRTAALAAWNRSPGEARSA